MTRRRAVVIATATVLLVLGSVIVGGIAILTQTDRGRALVRRALIPTLSAAIPGKLYVGRLSGTLFTGITIDSVSLSEPDGKPFLTMGRVTLTYDPRDLLDRRIVLHSVEIEHPVVTLVDYGDDAWSWKHALLRSGPKLPKSVKGRLGEYIMVDTATLRELTVVMRQSWSLSDTLKGVKRDSALTYNLTRLDAEIRAEPGRMTRTYRFGRGFVAFGKSRLADPDSAGQRLAVQKADIIWLSPPFWFRNMKTEVRKLGDSLWLNNATFNLAHSDARGSAKVVWGSRLPVRYDIRLHGDTVAMEDVCWIHPSLPQSGSGSVDFSIRNDPKDLSVLEYGIRNMDARSMRSRMRGNMTFGVGGPVLRVTDVLLDLQPAHTNLLRQFNGEPFPLDWQGTLSGHIVARGGPVTRFVVDSASLGFADEHVPGAVSRARLKGMVDIYTPSFAILHGVDVDIEQVDLRTPRFVNPLFPNVNGIVRGTVRLDSLWFDAWFSNGDFEHVDGPGQPSRFTGNGRYTILPEGVKFDVDMQASPLSYTTLARSYPNMPLRGLAVGSIKAAGMAEDFALTTALAGEGGELAFTGRADAFEPVYSARGTLRTRGVNLRSLFGDPVMPVTMLSMRGDVNLTGADLSSFRGTLNADVDEFSRVGDATLFGGTTRLAFDSGHVNIDTLGIESSAFRINAKGGIGLLVSRRDSVQFSVVIDSLGGLRPWLASGDSLPEFVRAYSDTVRGSVDVRGSLSGSIDTLDTEGVRLVARADGLAMALGSARAARGSMNLDVSDVMRLPRGTASITADSALIGGIRAASLVARATLRDGLADHFNVQLRTPLDASIAMAGGVQRLPPVGPLTSNRLNIDTLTIRVDTVDAPRARGFSLLTPAHLTVVQGGTGSLDSLVLVHTDTGRVALRGTLAANGAVDGAVDVDRLPLGDLGRLAPSTAIATGLVNLTARVSGTRELPRIVGDLALRDLSIGRVRIHAFDVNARYDSLQLALDGGLFVRDRRAFAATALLPMDLALVAGRTRRIDRPLVGRVVTDSVDLAVLEAVFPDVTHANGRLNTDVALTGSWERPRLRGRIALDGGALSLENLGVHLERVQADLTLAGDSLLVRRLGATSGQPGDSLVLTGLVNFNDPGDPVFDLHLAARNFLAIDKTRTASLTLSTTRPITLTGPRHAPTVRGDVRIDRGRVYVRALSQKRAIDLTDNFDVVDTSIVRMDALLPSPPSALVQNLTLDNVNIDVGDDVWLRSPEANIKLGGALRVTRAVGREGGEARLALSDSLTVQRGSYQLNLGLARPSFEVERGVIRFFGDPDLEPALDISALHTVRETRPNSNRQDVRIRVTIGGTLNRLSLALSSADNPPLPESDMLSYLVTGEPAYALLGTPYAEQGATLALRLAGSYLSSRLAGGRFDVVQVEPTALAPGDAANLRENGLGILAQTRLGVGGQIGHGTFLSISTGFCGLAQQSAGGDALSLFAQGLGIKVERRFPGNLSVALGLEPASSAQACGRLGVSRTFQQTPPQIGADLFKTWRF